MIDPRNFLLATRDSGYRTTESAIAEFVDNAIQANASRVEIEIFKGSDATHPIELRIADDGDGMSEAELSSALAFGGSSRFDDRSSLGRYGMGLPNAALSCARAVDVYSWRMKRRSKLSSLDIDELIASNEPALQPPVLAERPEILNDARTGTVVHLRRCDRLQFRRVSTIASKLTDALGRTFRHFLTADLQISVNGDQVNSVDPLFVDTEYDQSASLFGEPLVYDLSTDYGTGQIRVLFSELPIEAWNNLSSADKRQRGITKASNVSVVRAGREIDSGWWFMGTKRRQNYDDWWRCEVQFEPVLDELFGITHTKQQVTPAHELRKLLSPDLEPIANALNARVRQRFERANSKGPLDEAAHVASLRSRSLPPIPSAGPSRAPTYDCQVGAIPGTSAFEVGTAGQDLSVTINERHPLYRDVLKPLVESEAVADHRTATGLALMILALARTEAASTSRPSAAKAKQFRHDWSDVAASFLNA